MSTWALLEANYGPWGPPREMSRGLERKWARGFAVHTAPAEFTAERRGRGGRRDRGSSRGHCLVTL